TDTRALHYIPTRRSSDLLIVVVGRCPQFREHRSHMDCAPPATDLSRAVLTLVSPARFQCWSAVPSAVTADLWRSSVPPTPRQLRSEEHTSELQSRFDLVC